MKTLKLALAIACVAALTSVSNAQTPGDGIPDVYYYQAEAAAPNGVTLPAGWLTVDTDGSDLVTLLVGSGIDASQPTDGTSPGCDLCEGGFLPDPNAPPFNVSSWTVGNIAGSTQWVRTSPLSTLGYQGVIGQDADPSGIFPSTGLAYYGEGATFDKIFIDANGTDREVTFATLDTGTIFTDVTFVTPEPASFGLLGMAILGLLGLRRR